MHDFKFKEKYDVNDLVEIMKILRGENGCPWDREQDHKSIRKNFLEETYEVLEAIDAEDASLLREELGDVLLQVVFHSQMEAEKGVFDFSDVADEVCKKLIERHPHVFGEISVENSGEVLKNWDNIKQASKGQETYTETLKSVPKILPALMKSYKIGQRAKRAGMDFKSELDAFEALESEVGELKKALDGKCRSEIEDELGDVLFSAVNVARKLEIDPEECLSKACEKFIKRFAETENLIRPQGIDMKTLGIDELDVYWRLAKQKLAEKNKGQ
jgi:tetrapyrrole methylase family protein/MazG family protein